MPIFTVGAAGTTSSSYEVDNSLRFSEDSGDYLRNPASGASVAAERKTLTFSLWVKRAKLGSASSTQYMICGIESTGNYYSALMFNSTDQLRFFHNENGTTRCDLKTNRVFRDTSAWYHIVLAIDTTQGTDSNRVKIYVNGVQETSFATETYYSSSFNTYFGMTNGGDGYPTYIGSNASSDHFDGYMAEVVGVGGSQLAASDFAESDSNTGIWKPKDLSDLSYGSGVAGNFLLQFQTSGTLGDDTSGNNNDFTVTNLTSVDQSTDTPTNNYNVLNFLTKRPTANGTITNGNLQYEASTGDSSVFGTLPIPAGMKVYFEVKLVSNTAQNALGIFNEYDPGGVFKKGGDGAGTYSYKVRGAASYTQYFNNGSATTTSISNYSNDTIIGVAIDNENGQIHYHANGTYINSSDPTDNDPVALVTGFGGSNEQYLHFSLDTSGGTNPKNQFNFGSPLHSISSSNSDANGHGNFEYAVPSGYYALNSKNLAQFG